MAGDSAEEKKHPPTSRRLRDLRRDGQVPHSRDFPGVLSLVAVLALLVGTGSGIGEALQGTFAFDAVGSSAPFAQRAARVAVDTGAVVARILAPVFAVAVLVMLLAQMVDSGGLPASTKPLTPDLNKLSPVEGVKRLFGLSSLIELLKSIVRIILIAAVAWMIVRSRLNDVMWSPTCGLGCVEKATVVTVVPLIAAGAAILLVAALIDLRLARWLFTRENRMTDSELKRDRREDSGDPHVQKSRRQRRDEILSGPTLRGVEKATLVIAGDGVAVGIAYQRGSTPAPVLVAKGDGARAASFRETAVQLGIPVIEDPVLAADLHARAPLGQYVPEAMFDDVARVLVASGAL